MHLDGSNERHSFRLYLDSSTLIDKPEALIMLMASHVTMCIVQWLPWQLQKLCPLATLSGTVFVLVPNAQSLIYLKEF